MNEGRLRFLFVLGLCFGLTGVAQAQVPPVVEQQRGRPLAPREAVLAALRSNPALRSSQLDVARARQDVLAEEGRYPYVFGADAGYTRSVQPRLSAGDVVRSSSSSVYTVGTALRRTFPFGTSAEFRLQGDRFENDIADSGISSPAVGSGYDVIARASVVQPLLRGFGTRVGEAGLRAARDSELVSDRSRQRATSLLARDVLLAYWELWFAGQAVNIDQAALQLAKTQEDEARARVEQGAMAPADVLTFSTRVAELEESVVLSDVERQRRSLELSRLMGSTGSATLEPIAVSEPPRPAPLAGRAELEAAVRSGSVELAESEAQARLARTRAEIAGEDARPRLDFDAFVQSEGVSENVPRAARRAGELNWITAHAGLTFELPLDSTAKNAQRASAQLAVQIADQNVQATRDRIATEAALALATESSALRRLELAQRTLSVTEKAYEAERARFELGQVIPLQVQEAEDDLRRARLGVARARVDLAEAQVATQHLSGRLLAEYAALGPRR